MKKVMVLLANGFEEIEALATVDILRRANVVCDMVSIGEDIVETSHGMFIKSDKTIEDIEKDYDAIILPGGMPGAKNLKENSEVINLIKMFNDEGKIIGAICAAPIVLYEAEILVGKKYTCYPGFEKDMQGCLYTGAMVEKHGNIITGKGPGAAFDFAFSILRELGYGAVVDSVKNGMLIQ